MQIYDAYDRCGYEPPPVDPENPEDEATTLWVSPSRTIDSDFDPDEYESSSEVKNSLIAVKKPKKT